MRIRRAEIDDVAAISTLFDGYRQFYQKPSDPASCRRFIHDRLEAGESIIFVAENEQSRMIGFTQLYDSFCSVELKPLMYLYDLFVEEAARGAGVARALMAAAREHAVLSGADRITLETHHSNVNAQALYESLGYEKDVDFTTYHLAIS